MFRTPNPFYKVGFRDKKTAFSFANIIGNE